MQVKSTNRARTVLLNYASEALDWAVLIERVTNHVGDTDVVVAARRLLAAIETRAQQLVAEENEG